jgi:hypothetical protein
MRYELPSFSNNWPIILDREVKANGGKISIDTLISVVVDREGSGKEYDSFHGLQYFFNPVDYLNRLVDKEQPEVMNPKSPQYGLISRQLVEKARYKLFYEMDGFYISGFFKRGHEKETLAAADMIEDLRSGQDSIRGIFDPGYLYFSLGKLMILKLREDYQKQEGDNFTLQKFHDQLLENGMPPIQLLRERLLKDKNKWDKIL